jgi:hypothetical protein
MVLAVVKKLLNNKADDAASLQQQIDALRREGADASAEIERLKGEAAAAPSYDEARDIEDRINRQIWVTRHCAAALPELEQRLAAARAAALPELEQRLAAARAAAQAAALAAHTRVLINLYPKLKAAILAAVEIQREVMLARQAAVAELGENMVARNLPTPAFAGFLLPDLVQIWAHENDRVFADLARKPRPAPIPAPVRAALPAPAEAKAAAAAAPAPAKRVARHDPFPTDGREALVTFLRAGAELPDGTTAGTGDEIALPVEVARALVQRGAADYVTAPVPGEAS